MEYQQNYTESAELKKLQATFITRVYGWMFLALAITGIVSIITVSTPSLMQIIYGSGSIGFYMIIGAQLLLVMGISWGINRISSIAATLLFLVYAAMFGLTLSWIFLVYRLDTIASTFFVTSLTFGTMSAVGYFTKKDLTSLGQLMIMGLVGVVIASITNWFLHSETLYWAITYIGLFIFIGLVAYDTQKIKRMAILQIEDPESGKKGAILGALHLYLDFINIFLFLLRILGGRK
jgi:FtsH-binding integral membrane protein